MAEPVSKSSVPSLEELQKSTTAARGEKIAELYAGLGQDLYFKVTQMPSVARFFRIRADKPGADRFTQVLLSAAQFGWPVSVYYSREEPDIGDVIHLFAEPRGTQANAADHKPADARLDHILFGAGLDFFHQPRSDEDDGSKPAVLADIPAGPRYHNTNAVSINGQAVKLVFAATREVLSDRAADNATREVGRNIGWSHALQNGQKFWWNVPVGWALYIAAYNLDTGAYGWHGARNTGPSWEIHKRGGGRYTIPNGRPDPVEFPIAGLTLELLFKNPNNTNGFTPDDIIYSYTVRR